MKTIAEKMIKFGLPVAGLLCAVYIILNCHDKNYQLLFLLPLMYFLLSFFLMRRFSFNSSIFYIVINIIIFARYTIQPYLIVKTEYYHGRSPIVPQESSFITAIFLMLAELFFVSVVMLYLENKFKKKKLLLINQFQYSSSNYNNSIYYIFFLFVGIYAFFDRSWIGVIHFITPVIELGDGDAVSIYAPYLILIAKQIILTIIIYKLGKLNSAKNRRSNFSLFAALLLVFLNIVIFLGTNRSDIIITALATLLFLKKNFGEKLSVAFLIIGFVAVLGIINSVTEARGMKKLNDSEQNYAELLNAYLGGVYNVAIAVETPQYFPEVSKPKTLFYDIFRSMIGVNFFLKGDDVVWSNTYYNRRLLNEDRRSQILPMIGQGYIFFNFLAPILSVAFVFLAYYLMNFVYTTRDPLIFYFLLLTVIRLGFFMGQNTMNQINDLSYNLFLFLSIYYFNNKIQLK